MADTLDVTAPWERSYRSLYRTDATARAGDSGARRELLEMLEGILDHYKRIVAQDK